VTASFGFIAAAEVLKIIQQRHLKYLKQLNTEK
jgi:hypothetical protein